MITFAYDRIELKLRSLDKVISCTYNKGVHPSYVIGDRDFSLAVNMVTKGFRPVFAQHNSDMIYLLPSVYPLLRRPNWIDA